MLCFLNGKNNDIHWPLYDKNICGFDSELKKQQLVFKMV